MSVTCGVEISTRLLKYVVLQKRGKTHRVLAHGRHEIESLEDAATILREARAQGLIPTSRIRVAAARRTSRLQDLRLPPMPKKELRAVVRGEVERELELLHEDLEWRYQILPSEKDQRRVLVALTPRSDMHELLRELVHAGFLVEVLTPASAALLSHLVHQKWTREAPEPFAVVHVELSRTVVAIVDAGNLRLLRDLNLGLDTGLLRARAGDPETPDLEVDALESLSQGLQQISEVATQIRRTLDYDRRHFAHRPVERIYLAGDVARSDDLLRVFHNEVRLTTEVLDPGVGTHLIEDAPEAAEGASFIVPMVLARETRLDHFSHFEPDLPSASTPPALRWAGVIAGVAVLVVLAQIPNFLDHLALQSEGQALLQRKSDLEAQTRLDENGTDYWAALQKLERAYQGIPLAPVYRLGSDWPDPAWLQSLRVASHDAGWRIELAGTFDLREEDATRRWGNWLSALERDARITELRLEPVAGIADAQVDQLPVAIGFSLAAR